MSVSAAPQGTPQGFQCSLCPRSWDSCPSAGGGWQQHRLPLFLLCKEGISERRVVPGHTVSDKAVVLPLLRGKNVPQPGLPLAAGQRVLPCSQGTSRHDRSPANSCLLPHTSIAGICQQMSNALIQSRKECCSLNSQHPSMPCTASKAQKEQMLKKSAVLGHKCTPPQQVGTGRFDVQGEQCTRCNEIPLQTKPQASTTTLFHYLFHPPKKGFINF